MDNEYEPTDEQKKEWIVTALEQSGFNRIGDMDIYTHDADGLRTVVDLTAGISIYFKDGQDRIDEDRNGILAAVGEMIADAMTGQLPSRTDSDEVITKPTKQAEPKPTNNQAEPTGGTELVEHPVTPPANIPVKPPATKQKPAQMVQFQPAGRMIKGLSPQLKEIGKIKIGRKGESKQSQKGTTYRPPEKFDHFEVVTVTKDEHGDFIPDAAIMGLIGNDAKELDVSLLYNDPTLNFMTRYNEYKGGKCMCSGDGENAAKEDGTKLICDPDTCPTFQSKKCKANGILSVILKDAPRLGGVYKFRTTSINSIRSILSSMFFIQSLTGGVLANIPLKMTVSPQSVNPIGSKTAQTIYVVNLEYPGNVEMLHKQVIGLMTEQADMQSKIAELEQQARDMVVSETTEEIQEVEAEFYPDVPK